MTARDRSRFDAEPGGGLRFLYKTFIGRIVLWILVRPAVSRLAGRFMDSRLSAGMIARFIKKNGIDMRDYEDPGYRSFNEFFTRRVKEGARPVCMDEGALVAPCDARLSAYKIDENAVFYIKGSPYTIEELLHNRNIAAEYNGGYCLIFRLAVDDYHRYCYFDDCEVGDAHRIAGVFHTVQPVALGRVNFYARNTREYTLLQTRNFGAAVQIEVGAMMVGRIRNTGGAGVHRRGDEKGMFEFGGSTVAVLLRAGAAEVDGEIVRNTAEGYETRVRLGERIGGVRSEE